MATLKEPFALDRSLNTTEVTPRNIADVLAEELSRITGRNASQVEYDNTESGLTADNVQDALDEIVEDIPTVPSVDIQTAVDEFETYNGGLLSSLKVSLTPNQDLHGYDSPWVGGAGKNKFNGEYSYASASVYSVVNPSTVYTLSTKSTGAKQINYQYIYADDSFGGDGKLCDAGATSGSVTITTPSNAKGIEIYAAGTPSQTASIASDTQLELGSTATDYEPYSNICPISGHTQVEVQNHQKNLCDDSLIVQGDIDNSAGADTADGSLKHIRSGYCNAESSTQYTVSHNHTIGSGTLKVFEYRSDKSFIRRTNAGAVTSLSYTFTTHSECKYIRIAIYDENGISKGNTWIQLELGSTATAYVPYNGYQVTVNLGGTYYSGILDVVTGVFTPDTAFDTLSADNFNGETGTSGGGLHYYDWNNGLSKKSGICLCSMMPQNNTLAWQSTTPCIQMSSGGGVIRCYVEEATKEAFKTAYSGMQICYELATPTPIQLSPTMVKALVGENHLSAPLDGQEITESKYKQMFTFDDVIAYIQSLS